MAIESGRKDFVFIALPSSLWKYLHSKDLLSPSPSRSLSLGVNGPLQYSATVLGFLHLSSESL